MIAVSALALRDGDVITCFRAFAHNWPTAGDICRLQSERTGDPHAGVRAARALFRKSRYDEALTVAKRWFDTEVDPTARQIAARVHQLRSEHRIAQPLFERALEGHLRTNDHGEAARDAQMLAGSLGYQGLLGDALDKATVGIEQADCTDDLRLKGYMRLGLGKILAEIGDAARARMMYLEALEQTSSWPADKAWVYLQLGMLTSETGRREDGVKLLEAALSLARAHAVPQVVTAARLNLARDERELGHGDIAERYLQELGPEDSSSSSALFVAGLIAADRGDRVRAEQLLARAAADPPTDDYAMDIVLQRGKLAERSGDEREAERFYRQAIGFVDQLRASSKVELRPWVLEHRREPYSALLAILARVGRQTDALEIAEQLHARTWHDAALHRSGAGSIYADIAFARSVERTRKGAAAPAVSREQLLALLRHRDALLFSDTGAGVWRFHVVDGVIRALDRLPEELPGLVEQWRAAPDDKVLAARLGEVLVPSAAYEPSMRPLYIVADGILGTVPFAALRYAEQHLVERRVIARLPGVIALRCRSNPEAPRSAVFLGDSWDDLPAARKEAVELAAQLGGKAFVGHTATRDRLASSKSATLLHLAVHADEPTHGSGLLLANGPLSSAEIVEMGLGPRLVVLAGCATAVSRDVEGWDALSSAFLVSGSSTVIATLQAVKDTDSAVLVRRFYALDGEQQPALALALAQRELLSSGEVASWASFVVLGSVEPSDCVSLQ